VISRNLNNEEAWDHDGSTVMEEKKYVLKHYSNNNCTGGSDKGFTESTLVKYRREKQSTVKLTLSFE